MKNADDASGPATEPDPPGTAAGIVSGSCAPAFEALRNAFADSLRPNEEDGESRELGASIAVARRGKLEVELWGGWADDDKTRPWQRDTLVNVYSVTKGITATCVHRLVEAGKLELDAPVAGYWTEFAAEGKGEITLRQLLCHQAGLAGIREKIAYADRYDRRAQAAALAAQAPWWEPGSQHGYHAVTFGTLLGELVERVDGRSLGRFWRDEIAEPAGIDFHIGLREDAFARCADIVQKEAKGRRAKRKSGEEAAPRSATSAGPKSADNSDGFSKALQRNRESLLGKAFANPAVPSHETNSPEWRAAELPAHGGHGTAAALARFYSALASDGTLDGFRILRPETIRAATTEQVFDRDAVLAPLKTRFGLGFMLSYRGIPMGPGRENFGHPGYGGAIAFADPTRELGFAYVINRMQSRLMGGAEGSRLVDLLYEALGDD